MTNQQRKNYNLTILTLFATGFVLFGLISLLFWTFPGAALARSPFPGLSSPIRQIVAFIVYGLMGGWLVAGVVGGFWLGIRFVRAKGRTLIILACVLFPLTYIAFVYIGMFAAIPFAIYSLFISRKGAKESEMLPEMREKDMYNKFSDTYDKFIDVEYHEWIAYIEAIWEKFELKPHLVLDLACGTGNFTIELADKGYDMIGIDNSAEMLSRARDKACDKPILFSLQDMRGFELYGTVDACICMVDSINYLLEENELSAAFELVHNYLNPGGLFIFDINTLHKFRNVLGENSFSDVSDDDTIVWENYFDDETRINEYMVNIFVARNDGLYERHEEVHQQRAYEKDDIVQLLTQVRFEVLGVYDTLKFEPPTEESEKIFFVAQKNK